MTGKVEMNNYPSKFVAAVFSVFLLNISLQIGILFFTNYIYTIEKMSDRVILFVAPVFMALIILEAVLFTVKRYQTKKHSKENAGKQRNVYINHRRSEEQDLSGFWWALLCCVVPIFFCKLVVWKLILIFDLNSYEMELDPSVAIVAYVAFRTYHSWKHYEGIRDENSRDTVS